MKFTEKEEKLLIESFNSYSDVELKDFITHAFSERIMLTLSLNSDDPRNTQREVMLGMLERLQKTASDKLKERHDDKSKNQTLDNVPVL